MSALRNVHALTLFDWAARAAGPTKTRGWRRGGGGVQVAVVVEVLAESQVWPIVRAMPAAATERTPVLQNENL